MAVTPIAEETKRRRHVSKATREKLATLRLPREADESFYAGLRECLLAAGATEADLDGVAAGCVVIVVECMRPEWEDERRDQFELIAHHLACADMVVSLGEGDSYIQIQFPNRARVH
jgi:hypothetical protein